MEGYCLASTTMHFTTTISPDHAAHRNMSITATSTTVNVRISAVRIDLAAGGSPSRPSGVLREEEGERGWEPG